jgi:16S rRNA (adenine1518-N6/adenine1519-N6)-dimethyltransferase
MERIGQHFMIDQKVLQKIVDSAKLETEDRILEIGPGGGSLTKLLSEKCKVNAIEKDQMLFGKLQVSYPRIDFILGDALELEWPPFDKCVSNLPYYISKPFSLKLLQHKFKMAVLVLQEEFAQKLVAKPGEKNYGAVSVCAQLCCDIELLDKVPRNAFKPQPRVNSRIVRLRQKRLLEKGFLDFVASVFQRRNRKLGEFRIRDLTPQDFLILYEKKNG